MLSPKRGKALSNETMALAVNIVGTLALTVMIPMRSRLGLRILGTIQLICLAFFLYLVDSSAGMGSIGLVSLYAAFLLLYGLYEQRNRRKELREGKFWHTRSHGISRLEFLPLSQRRIYGAAEPAIAFIVGMFLRNIGFGALGLVIEIGAIALFIFEELSFQQGLETDLDTVDSLIEAQLRAAAMNQMRGDKSAGSDDTRANGGIPTGADAELREQIERRRREAQQRGEAA